MTTVNWVLDSNGNLEISSVHHLLQLMHRGFLYTDTGAAPVITGGQNSPTDFWYQNYIQTVDIDLSAHHADIAPIGEQYAPFEGFYDGQEFRISNWAYTDPATDNAGTLHFGGLFGSVINGGSVRNVRMDGVCILDGFNGSGGMFAGNYHTTDPLYNIECDFSPGSYIKGGGANVGGMIGWCQGSLVNGLTLKGTLDLSLIDTDRGVTTNPNRIGGVIGTSVDDDYYNIRNLAKFPNGIVGSNFAGGIVGDNIRHQSFTNLMNYMEGDISGLYVGGIFGKCGALTGGTVQNAVNSMTGDLNGTSGCGGIIGQTGSTNLTVSDVANYMTGDITSTRGGGIVGHMSSVIPVTNSVNAMNGSVDNSVAGNTTSSASSVYVDTSFGLVATGSDHATATLPTGWMTDSTFTDLPYFDVTRTDSLGNIYNWDFVFGNLSGKAAYSSYTHLSLHAGNVSAPLYTVMDLVNTNTTTYLAFANLGTETLFMDDSITHYESVAALVYDLAGLVIQIPTKSPMDLTAGADNINVVISEITGAVTYRLSIEEDGGSEVIVHDGITVLTQDITSLSFETLYTVRLYVDTGSGYTLEIGKSTTTLPEPTIYKIVLANDNYVHFTEFELYDSNGTNIALLGTATQSATFQNAVASIGINGYNDGTVAPGDTYNFCSTAGAGDWTLTLDKAYKRSELINIIWYNRISTVSEANRAIGTTITLYYTGDVLTEELGVLSGDLVQEFVITEKLMSFTPSVATTKIYVTGVDGASAYRIDVLKTSTGKRVFRKDFSTIDTVYMTTAGNLTPLTSYTVNLFTDTGSGLELTEGGTFDTLANSAGNYNVNDFGGSGNFDLSSLGSEGVGLIDEFMNDLFTTGDNIELKLTGTPNVKKSTFVNRGSTVSIDGADALVAPFDENSGTGQEITMTLSDNTTASVSYDETSNSITVASNTYSPGESFILDGKKVVVFDL